MRDKCLEIRDRLVELQCLAYDTYEGGKTSFEHTADVLLANGVIVPPCKVGDMVYFVLDDFEEEPCIVSQRINEVGTRGIFVSDSLTEENCRIFVPYSDFGENVFLDKAEAERALKGGE